MNTLACRDHEWALQDGGSYACTQCAARAKPCLECGSPLASEAQLVCPSCVARWQGMLEQIGTWVSTFRANPFTYQHSTSYDPNRVTTSEDDVRLPFGLDAIEEDPEGKVMRGIPDAVARLKEWAATWASWRGEPADWEVLEYLVSRVQWAMQNREESEWEIFSSELHQVRAVVQRELGIAPVREPVPCVYCGGQIIRRWTSHGLGNLRRCSTCGAEWAEAAALAHTNHLVMQELPETHPALQVTLDEASRIYRGRLSPKTLMMWRKRGRLLAVDVNFRGQDVYVLGDIANLVAAMPVREVRA